MNAINDVTHPPAAADSRPEVPRRSWVALAVLFLIGVFNYLDRTIIGILQIPMKAELGFSDTQLGLLLGASFGLVYTTLGLPLGRLADRTSRKGVLAGALILWTGLTTLTGFARSYSGLLACRVGVALGEAGCAPITHSLISDYFPKHRRATAVSLWALSLPLGILLGFLLGGWLSTALGWRHAFLYVGLAGMLLAPIMLIVLREPTRGAFDGVAEAQPLPPVKQVLRVMWNCRSYRLILAATALHLFAFYAVSTWLPQFYARAHGLSIKSVGVYMALIGGVGGFIGMACAGYLSDRFGSRDARWYVRLPAIASLLLAPLNLLQLYSPSLMTSVVVGMANGALFQIYFAPMIATTQSLMPSRVRTFTGAFYVFFVNVFSMSLGPLVVGLLSDRLGGGPDALTLAMSVCLVGTVAASGIYFRVARTLREDLIATPAHVFPV